ncbi:MAG: HlyD family efflux transporter periplasmic adaptor subunit [Eubacteriales bacterium]|nr:HlyD family efflux transporter periplasmic adaptor subunit [Eubacteriales bacterium]
MNRMKLSKKLKIRLAAAGVALLLLIAAAVYTVFILPGRNEQTYVYKEETVSRGDVIQGVMESGSIALSETSVAYDVDVNVDDDEDEDDDDDDDEDEAAIHYLEIGEVYVVSGQRISEGDPLFSITEKSRSAVIKKLQSNLTEKEIALTSAKAQYNSQALEAKSTYDNSMLSYNSASAMLEAATTQLEEEINGLSAQTDVLELEINQCLEKLTDEDFLDSLNEAKQAYEKAKGVYEETDVHSVAAYTANYQSYVTAEQQYESLLSQKEEWEETIAQNQETILANQEEMEKAQSILEAKETDARNTYELSVGAGELAEDIYSYTVQALQDTVDAAQEECAQAQETLEALEAFVGEDGIVYADGEGLVTAVYYEAGDELAATGPLLSYVKESDYTVSIDVSEEDIAGISIGDSVQIAFDAYPEEAYTGTVISITTTKTSDYAKTVSYPVEIQIEGDTQKLYGGMTAGITFVTDSVTDVLYVSRKAIVKQDGKTWVYTGDGEEKELTEVVTGFENSTVVEIKEGLSEGDVIYIRSNAG